MSNKEQTDPRLLALFERMIRDLGGVYAVDVAAGLSRGTLSRWTTRTEMRPSAENLRRLAASLGARYGVTTEQLLEWGGYLDSPAEVPSTTPDPTPKPVRVAFQRARERLTPEAFAALEALIANQVPMVTELIRTGKLGPTQYNSATEPKDEDG